MSEALKMFSLKGKVALVTGATGYLGEMMVFNLASAGAKVYVNSRSEEKAVRLIEKIAREDFCIEKAIFDVNDAEQIQKFVMTLNDEAIHILVNNAYAGNSGVIENSSSKSYIDSYNVSVVAAHNLLTNLLPNLRQAVKKTGEASIINISSMYGIVSPDYRIYESKMFANPPFYGAAKAALLQWTRYAACEFGAENIRVNAISPGPFPSLDVQEKSPNFIKKLEEKVPMSRVGRAEELGGALLFLASSASSFVNGANLVVDGGWTVW